MAMTTSMANSAGEMTRSSSPMFKTMSSMRPRVFMRTPSAEASRQPMPVSRAAIAEPPNFPIEATPMMARQTSHSAPVETRPISVRMPVKAKNAGNRRTTTMSSRRSVRSRARLESCGMTAPMAKAPKTAWMPMTSVAHDAKSSPTKTRAMTPWVRRPRFP